MRKHKRSPFVASPLLPKFHKKRCLLENLYDSVQIYPLGTNTAARLVLRSTV